MKTSPDLKKESIVEPNSNQDTPTKEQLTAQFRVYEEMFETQGWRDFVGTIKDMVDASLNYPEDKFPTNDDWQQARGYMKALRYILAFEDIVKRNYENSIENVDY